MPKKVEQCVDSIMEDNPEMDKSTAFAICQDQLSDEKCIQLMKELGLDVTETKVALELLSEDED